MLRITIGAWGCRPPGNPLVPDPPGKNCRDESNYTVTTPAVWVEVKKRNADIIYNLSNWTIERFERLSPVSEPETLDPVAYLRFFDKIFPQWPNPEMNQPRDFTLEVLLFRYCLDACFSSPGTSDGFLSRPYLELLMLPWQSEQLFLNSIPDEDLPRENMISCAYCRKSYKISLSPTSFFTFSFFSIATIVWCLFRLIPLISVPVPVLSLFPELNLVGNSQLNRTDVLNKITLDAPSTTVERILADVNIKIVKEEGQNLHDGLELNEL